MALPAELAINAWTGSASARSAMDGEQFAKRKIPSHEYLWPGPPVSDTEWRHEKIGWGLVLLENDALTNEEKARATDAPEPIKELLAARPGAPVFRYAPTWNKRFTHLRRYLPSGLRKDLQLVGSEAGVGPGCVPLYLLIYGTPAQIPWQLQFSLNGTSFVGRLDLEGDALARYVGALIGGFGAAGADRAVVWGVDHETGDITQIMRRTIAQPLYERLRADTSLTATYLERAGATRTRLLETLAREQPGLVVTTSHGMTAPLDDPTTLAANLGLLVDSAGDALSIDALLDAWKPEGAIWYAHACCSAGADGDTAFAGLVKGGSAIDNVLRAIAASGSRVAPLPRALLGAPRPLRAFVGHVEPTFDWTLREPSTGQVLTHTIRDALYERLYRRSPIAHAFGPCHREGSALSKQHDAAMDAYNKGEDTLGVALACRLTARDRERLVILGDPTVALSVPPGANQ